MRFWLSAAADAAAVAVFAAVGRRSHGELTDWAGTWNTAWPFLAGAALGTVLGRAWRDPGSLRSGVFVWAGTLAGGMVLRALTGGGVAPSFVMVAGAVLAALLLGWRAVRALIRRSRTSPVAA